MGVEIKNNLSLLPVEESLDELSLLSSTAGLDVVGSSIQRLSRPNSKTFVGPGKLEEIKILVDELEASVVIFDEELLPRQQRELERQFGEDIKILDRTALILDIFAQHAQTREGKLQVELAQLEYRLPRLTRMWTHLERQRGGIGLRGPGETEIETDRRIIRDKITRLKEQLGKIDKQMATQRKNRGKMIRVSLVGYTNVGKSTIMNMLSKSNVFAENKLFATLDTTTRELFIDGKKKALISDTVGFISQLPHHLIEAFKSTLDELNYANPG